MAYFTSSSASLRVLCGYLIAAVNFNSGMILLIVFATCSAPGPATGEEPLPAFAGAEGFGANTAGGRGGRVVEVTNLNDQGPGSLRAAIEAEGPRIVVFRVGGTIEVNSPLAIAQPAFGKGEQPPFVARAVDDVRPARHVLEARLDGQGPALSGMREDDRGTGKSLHVP